MKRRLFLRGLGGAVVAAPFLRSVAERQAKARGETVVSPQRLIVMFTHYGCLTDRFFPATAHGALTAEDFSGLSLEPLAPYADKILIPRGIRAMNEWNAQMSRGQGNDTHTQVVGSFLTCVPVTPNSNDPFSFDASTKFNAMPTAASLDHVCAKQLSPGGVPLYMRVSGRSDNAQSAVSYSGSEEPYPGIGSLSQAYSNLTGLFSDAGDPNQMTPDTYEARKGKTILDIVRGDLETLERFDMSASDRQKLEAWKALLLDTGNVVASAQCNEELAANLALSGNLDGNSGLGGDMSAKVSGELDTADLFSNIAVLAAVCNANPVIFLKYPASYIFSGIGLNVENHGLSHRIGDAGMGGRCLDDVNDLIQTVDRYYAEKFAFLIGQLDSIDEGNGTVLDNSATVWLQEMSDGNAHNLNNLPIIQAGGAGGYFKTGQSINVVDGDASLSRGNSVGQCENGGDISFEQVTSSATPAEYANAPINKYYCNLMNALGVKAGADGFPLEGGTGEVTHFGMYDKTEDFVGGGSKPATIHDPGGFAELLANG